MMNKFATYIDCAKSQMEDCEPILVALFKNIVLVLHLLIHVLTGLLA